MYRDFGTIPFLYYFLKNSVLRIVDIKPQYAMNDILLSSIPLKDFETLIRDCVKSELQNYNLTPPQEDEYITRKETSKVLGISLPTLNDWSKRGVIPSYKIASRVRYKKAEVMASLTKVQSIKYGRGQ